MNGKIAIEFKNVIKSFDGADYNAVDDVSFQIEQGELITVLGTSGCGKTTLLKMVNRLYEPTSGIIEIFGNNIESGDAIELRRSIGYVIQQVGLFPHMTVEKNISVVPEILGWDKELIRDRVTELLRLVNMDPEQFRGRYPSQLSGGQQQRVGLARALAAKPSIMLLDEPFGAIDAINRTKLQDEFLKIHRREGVTAIFVTHDVTEALKLGSRVMIMNEGRLQQLATPEKILSEPANDYVASLIRSVTEGLEFLK
ncbi:MAG: ABC transporter ATP-binding protein [Emergencia sp.]